MLTVTQLASNCKLSRSTVLYYERIGLLKRPPRTAGNYRCYGDKDAMRLRQICVYRNAGLKLADIRALLDGADTEAASVLKRRLGEIDVEIGRLREHQQSIVRLLRSRKTLGRTEMMTKEKWVSIMKAAGFSQEQMHRWHTEFERSAPEEHDEFLHYLHIPTEEIRTIRDMSRKGAK